MKKKKSKKLSEAMKQRWAASRITNGPRYVIFDKQTNTVVGELKLTRVQP